MNWGLSQHLSNLVQNDKATCRGVRDIIASFFFFAAAWIGINYASKATRCVPCDKMCDGTREEQAEHNRRLKERKWEQDRKNRI